VGEIELDLLLTSYVVLVGFLTGWECLLRLSPGRVRRIETEDRALAERAERWIADQAYYDTIFRITCMTLLGIGAILLMHLLHQLPRFQNHSLLAILVCAAIIVAAVTFAEAVVRLLLDRCYITMLKIFMPLAHALRCTLLAPVIFMLRYVSAELEANPAKDKDTAEPTAEDEIMSLVDQDNDSETALEETEKKMIKGIFDLDDTPVREIMTPRVDMLSIPLSTPVADARKTFLSSGHSRIPVYKDTIDEIAGVIYAKDFLDEERCWKNDLNEFLHKTVYVPETKNVAELLAELRQESTHLAVVIDEYGGTAGIVTLEDILEEIVGDIRDEYDTEADGDVEPVELNDGSVVFDARSLISDVNEQLDLHLPEDEDVDTIGGYVCGEIGRIPETGEEIRLDNHLKVKILKADRRKIQMLSVKVEPSADDD